MKKLTRTLQLALLITSFLAVGQVYGEEDTPLQVRMKTLAGNLRTVQTSLSAIDDSPTANHDSDWATAKTAAVGMAQAASEAKTLFPANVAGNAQAETAFTAAVSDLQSAIQDQLIKALDQHELNDAKTAVQVILDKKADGHNTFIPHH